MSRGPSRRGNPALHHDDREVGDAEHDVGELLDNQDRDAGRGDVGHQPVQLLDHDRSEAHRHLVEQQDGRLGDQRPRHGQHPLLAAGERSGELGAACSSRGKNA